MNKDLRTQLGKAAGELGMKANLPIEEPKEPETSLTKSVEIKQFDRVYLKSGKTVLHKYRGPGGALIPPTIGETVRMGYKDHENGFIVKALSRDEIYGEVAEIEPINFSYAKDRGSTYLVALEDITA